MRKYTQNINTKLIFLEILVVFTGVFIALYTYSIISGVKDNFELLNNVNTLKINVSNQDQEINDLISIDQFNISFYKNEKTNAAASFKNYHQHDSLIIANLLSNTLVKNNSTLFDRCLKIQDHLKTYAEKFHILTVNLKDRGYQNYGKSGEAFLIISKITETLGLYNEYAINQELDLLNEDVNAFVKTFDKNLLSDIYLKSNNVITNVYNLLELYPDIDVNIISRQTDLLNTQLNIVSEKNEEIGWENNSGIVRELKTISAEISGNLIDMSEILNKTLPVKNKKTTNLALIIILALTSIIGVFIILIIRSFLTPIGKLKTYLSKFVQGALPNSIELDANNEIGDIGQYLNQVVNGLKAKTEFATELGKGNLISEYSSISDTDTLGNALLTLQKSLQKAEEDDKKHQIDNERRRWTNEGLAKFSEILRMNNDNTEMLCDSVIKNLVKYLNASLGGMYLLNEEDKNNPHLYLASAFAYDRKKFLNDTIQLGEGLIGSCAQEMQTIYMTDIPEEYIRITSGLGDANPRVLLIVPLNLENEVLGVLEISAFEPLDDYVLDFVEKLAESIASTLASAKINERTQQLLEQSQKQAVEMAEQEEEMRQNMEELQATQEESTRRESEMFGILNAINATSYFFETDMNGTLTEINERMLFILEMQREHAIGMHHSELTSMNKNSPEYISFWDDLKVGNAVTKIQKFETISGNELWHKQNYTTIYNKEGEAVKIVCISTDISDTVQLEKDLQKLEREISSKSTDLEHLYSALDVNYIYCAINIEGEILDANSNTEKNLGYAKKELIGKKFNELIAKDGIKSFDRVWENIITGQIFNNIIKFSTSANEPKLIKSSFKPILNEKITIKVIFIGELYNSGTDGD